MGGCSVSGAQLKQLGVLLPSVMGWRSFPTRGCKPHPPLESPLTFLLPHLPFSLLLCFLLSQVCLGLDLGGQRKRTKPRKAGLVVWK